MSHLTDIFDYAKMHVLAEKPKLLRIENPLKDGRIVNPLFKSLLGRANRLVFEILAMNRILFYLFLKPFSMLPLPVIYTITYPFYLLLAYVIQYRKKVVIKSLTNSFPKKTSKEINEIMKKFYRHFFDQILESVKMISISGEECVKRFRVVNPKILDNYFDQGRNVALVIGHYNNWEFTLAMNAQMKHQFAAIYSPLSNAFMDQVVYKARSKLGIWLVPKHDMGKFLRNPPEIPFMLVFIADQSPKWKSKLHWTQFLNQNTAFATGSERYSQMLDMVTVFGRIAKVKRGHYNMTLEILSDKAKEEPQGRITELHVRALEKQIVEAPEYWLWTHKRWKKKVEKNLEK